MKLTAANLEASGWLFSTELGILVAEHELGSGKWDIEVNAYELVGPDLWECDHTVFYSSYKTVEELVASEPTFAQVQWFHGDDVNFA